jgi:hypothetical protein
MPPAELYEMIKRRHRLQYAAGGLPFFEGVQSHRTTARIFGAAALLVGGACIVAAAAQWQHLGDSRLIVLLLLGVAMGAAGLWLTCLFFFGADKLVRLDDDGIRDGSSFWGWERVQRIGGRFNGHRVELFFEPAVSGRASVSFEHPLSFDVLLTVDEYYELAGTLRRALAPRFPHLMIEERIQQQVGS